MMLLIVSVECFGQSNPNQYGFWNQRYLRGELGLKAQYRNQQRILGSGYEENIYGKLLSGGVLLESNSFIVHPNLLNLDINLEYNPEKVDQQFLVIPDRSEVRTLKRLNLRTTFFQEKDITVNGFINLNQNYINRENLTNSKINRRFCGGGVIFKNKILPLSITYQEGNWNQEEIETNRVFSYWQRNLRGRISKSFLSFDKHVFSYSYDDYIRRDYYTDPRQNTINLAELKSNFAVGSNNKYNLNTVISNRNQKGSDEFNRFQGYGNLILNLPLNFRLFSNYGFYDYRNQLYRMSQNRGKISLTHQLFESLKSDLYAESAGNRHTLYHESDSRAGFSFNYTKKIPIGKINLGYSYFNRNFIRDSDPVSLNELNEEHILSDDKIELLNKAYADPESVIVKDETGTVIYSNYFDYTLEVHNHYIEIRRIPGGQIPDNGVILVDYITELPGTYKYNLDNQSFSARLILFNQFLELYYHRAKQDYNSFEQSDLVVLNYFQQNVYGVGINFGFARIGMEYDNYESTIIPYKLLRYFANFQWSYRNKFIVSFVGNVRDYKLLGDRENEFYGDVSGRVAYIFNPKIKLNLELGYRNQKGYQIDLDLLTARSELTMAYRKIFFTAGLELYRRNYLKKETINFNGVYFQITRKF